MDSKPARNPFKRLRISDARGFAQLATDATTSVTSIAEGLHRSVWDTMGLPGGHAPGRTRGITGLVYKSIYGATRLAGKGVDTVLAGLESLESADDTGSPGRDALLAAINGVMGDRLAAGDNPLAIPMTLRYRRQALDWQALPPMPEASGKVLVLLHGLCMNDLEGHARHQGHAVEHGEALASALGYTPVYLRYNSGLHTSDNGRQLSALLEELVTHWPTPMEELTVVAHSMGGLLIRSALHQAGQAGDRTSSWTKHLKNVVFLGTPHHGAPLERAGNWVDVILGSTSYTVPFAKVGQLRSAGITDLRYGHLLAEDWHGGDRFQRGPDKRQVVSLAEDVHWYTVAATTAARRSPLADRLVGDGLVPLRSALGQHDDARRHLLFEKEAQWIAYGMNHMELLNRPEVTRQMVQWLSP